MFGGFGLRIVTIGEGVDTVPSALFTTNDTVFGPDETVAISSGSGERRHRCSPIPSRQ
ncbi:MAG: hypothetical protein RML45_12465 [Acetobacteraceae bacterium]|nr:hypothetical protein [Acetobacteraceae bacterium]